MAKKINVKFGIPVKGLIISVIILIGILLTIFGTLYFQKYTISELTTDIIFRDLKQNQKTNIFQLKTKTTLFLENNQLLQKEQGCFCNGTMFFQKEFALTSAIEITNGEKSKKQCCEYEILNLSEDNHPFIQVIDNSLNIYYQITYNKNNVPTSFLIDKVLFKDDYSRNPKNYSLKYFLQSVLDTNEFIIIKDTSKPNDFQYLVKDMGDDFLIYRFSNELNDPDFIRVALYKKQKYFNNFL